MYKERNDFNVSQICKHALYYGSAIQCKTLPLKKNNKIFYGITLLNNIHICYIKTTITLAFRYVEICRS